nr:Chain C, Breast cancer type 2 susceptibility protein [Homo sapiens]8C3J_J Chain J, Breast cancer type 2 susceptibility protein [Homo sapiens]
KLNVSCEALQKACKLFSDIGSVNSSAFSGFSTASGK